MPQKCAYVIHGWSLSLDEKNCTLTRMTGRRQKLPTIMPDNSSLNLWNLLCKNIGKDLSKISMPGKINIILVPSLFIYFNIKTFLANDVLIR